jgi:hypothetical protein
MTLVVARIHQLVNEHRVSLAIPLSVGRARANCLVATALNHSSAGDVFGRNMGFNDV